MAKIYNNNEKFSSAEEIYEDGKITTKDLEVTGEANMYNLDVHTLATGYFHANNGITTEGGGSLNTDLECSDGYFHGDVEVAGYFHANEANIYHLYVDYLTTGDITADSVRKANGGEWITGYNDLSDALNYLSESGIEYKGEPSSSQSFMLVGNIDGSSGTDMLTSGYGTGLNLWYEPGNRLYCNDVIQANGGFFSENGLQTGYITITGSDIQNNHIPWGQIQGMSTGYVMLGDLLQDFERRISALESKS